MRLPAALVALLALLAGCVSSEPDAPAAETLADEPEATGAEAATNASSGSLLVLARMPDMTMLGGVNVTVRGISQVTGPDGLVRFTDLQPGAAEVTARKEAHRTAQLNVTILPGQEVATEAVLPVNEGDQHAHEKGVFAHHDSYRFEGHFDCSATYVIITGDCMLLVDNLTTTAGAGPKAGDTTAERYLIDFALDASWTSLIVEMEWAANASTPATGGEMSLALEPAEAPADGHAVKYARAYGGSPLRVELAAGVKHETASAQDMPNPQGGEVIRARAYVGGLGNKPAGTEYLGLGATAQHDFVLYVSIFYGEPAPAGYSAIGGR